MFVVKRGGKKEPVHFDKITKRIEKLCYGLDENFIEPVLIAQKVVQGVYPGVTTSELDELAAETAAYMSTQHGLLNLGARISMSVCEHLCQLHGHRRYVEKLRTQRLALMHH